MRWIDCCLTSLRASSVAVKIIVIDNASTDGTPAHITAHFPEAELIATGENLGFGKANNIGLRKAVEDNADYVFLLNQDAWVQESTLQTLVQVADEHPEYGIISPLHHDGSNAHFDHKFIEYIQQNECPNLLEDSYFGRLKPIYTTTFVNAAAWLLPISCVKKVGGFDPLFPHYGEDVDYVQRCKANGMLVGIVPLTTICHDARVQEWSEIMWNEKRMLTIYLSEVKSMGGSLKGNMVVFLKNRFDNLTSHLLYRQFKLFRFRWLLTFKVVKMLGPIKQARKASKAEGAFL